MLRGTVKLCQNWRKLFGVKRLDLLTSGIVALYVNPRVHSAQKQPAVFGWESFNYPQYSSNLVLSDFHLLPSLKRTRIQYWSLANHPTLLSYMQDILFSPQDIFLKIIKCNDKCLNARASHVEKYSKSSIYYFSPFISISVHKLLAETYLLSYLSADLACFFF